MLTTECPHTGRKFHSKSDVRTDWRKYADADEEHDEKVLEPHNG